MRFFGYNVRAKKDSPQDIEAVIASIMSQGGDEIEKEYDKFKTNFDYILSLDPSIINNIDLYHICLKHGISYYYWKWDRRAVDCYDLVAESLQKWTRKWADQIDVICDLLDFFFFVVWCFSDSSTKQCQLALAPMRAASANLARASRPGIQRARLQAAPVVRIAWLAMYADSTNPMSPALRHVAHAVGANSGLKLSVYAWRFHDEDFLSGLRDLGCDCHVVTGSTPRETLAGIEALVAADSPQVVISDMNNAIPTVLFSRRIAPVQMFLQAGMPAWPVRNLDAVFNSFGFDPGVAGWGDARILDFNPPWALSTLDQPRGPDLVTHERASLPQAAKLIGSYGRLVKVTRPYLEVAERILQNCPDVAFVVGGTGDDSAIRSFIAASPVGDRMHLETRWVDGHVWGRLIDVFLDTWPVTGGESSREMIAKGRPVVTLRSEEMPAIVAQRDPALVAENWQEFCVIATRLLEDQTAYAAACRRSHALAERMSDTKAFAKKLAADISTVVADAQRRSSRPRFFGV